ncbi:MAG: hypothetical protein V2I54_00440 [Bacteroidales bacterium]|jgi:hypothetical protein|nr:hypothetical protein [Bacteroidales bacterium]
MRLFFQTFLKILFAWIIISFIPSEKTMAQETKEHDVVYLKNGSILHGKITEIKANETITLISYCGDKWVINQSEIEEIKKEEIFENQYFLHNNISSLEYQSHGFYSNVTVGFLFSGNIDTPFPPLSIILLGGYDFENPWSLGGGVGLDLLNETYMPVVADLKFNFTSGKINHFIYLQGGYMLSLEKPDPYDYDYYSYYHSDIDSDGGFLINPGIGLKLLINEKNAFSFGLGYKYIHINHSFKEQNGLTIDRLIKYNRVVLSFGYHFW